MKYDLLKIGAIGKNETAEIVKGIK